jgi:hypothetical protein
VAALPHNGPLRRQPTFAHILLTSPSRHFFSCLHFKSAPFQQTRRLGARSAGILSREAASPKYFSFTAGVHFGFVAEY